ncbi:major facilitator family transporter domain protein [Burkholderia pseudomallei]|nr:major facilitator family transporter domain protein [Burkholderia pseudomallei]
MASAIFPVLVGHMGTSMPLGVALGIDAGIAYGLVFVAVWFLPETRARDIQPSQPEARIREAAL